MTSLDPKGLQAAGEAYERYGQKGDLRTLPLPTGCIDAIITAYLSASTTPSGEVEGLEVAATSWVYMNQVRYAADVAFSSFDIDRGIVSQVTPLVRLSEASTALASMKREVERLTQANEALMQERTSLIETKREQIAQHRQDASDYLDALVKSDARLAQAVSLLERLQHWIEDEVGAEMPFTEAEQQRFNALVPPQALGRE